MGRGSQPRLISHFERLMVLSAFKDRLWWSSAAQRGLTGTTAAWTLRVYRFETANEKGGLQGPLKLLDLWRSEQQQGQGYDKFDSHV